MGTKRRVSPNSDENERKKLKGAHTIDAGAHSSLHPQASADERDHEQAAGHTDSTAEDLQPTRDPAEHSLAGHNELTSKDHEVPRSSNRAETVVDAGEEVEGGSELVPLTTGPSSVPSAAASGQWKMVEWAGIRHFCTVVSITAMGAEIVFHQPKTFLHVRTVVPIDRLHDPYSLLKPRPAGVHLKQLRATSGASKSSINERDMVFAQDEDTNIMLPAIVNKKRSTDFIVTFKHNGSSARLTRTKLVPMYLGDPGALSLDTRDEIWPSVGDAKAIRGKEGEAYRKQQVNDRRFKQMGPLPPPMAAQTWDQNTIILDEVDVDWQDILKMPPSSSAQGPAMLNSRLFSTKSTGMQCGMLIADSPLLAELFAWSSHGNDRFVYHSTTEYDLLLRKSLTSASRRLVEVPLTGQTESKMFATLDALRAKLRTKASGHSDRINMDVAFASFVNSYPTLGLHDEDVESDEFVPATRTKRTKKKKAGGNRKSRRHEQTDAEFAASPRDENGNQLCRRCNIQLDGPEELEDGYCHGNKCSYRCVECAAVLRSWEEDANEKSGGLGDEDKNYCSAHLASKQDGKDSDVVAGEEGQGGDDGEAVGDEAVDLDDEFLGLVP